MADLNLFKEAEKYIPGGVNSPARSFKAVGGCPLFVKRGLGSRIYDEMGNMFIDYCLGWGSLILGHSHPQVLQSVGEAIKNGLSFGTATRLEIDLAKLIIEALPSIEQLRLTNSGTEAVMTAIRLGRAYTRRNKIIKFSGAYHGHADYLLVKAGSGQATLGIPDSLGVPRDFTKHTISLPYNNIKRVREAVTKYQKEIAAIIVEPVAANCGVILPQSDFLSGLRAICNRHKIVLIFDEVITGFRVSYAGAGGYFQVRPDLTCLGKIIGGGLPVGAVGGKKEIMQFLAPVGRVYQAGTLSGNPLAVTAGITTLKILKEINPYESLEKKIKELCNEIKIKAQRYRIKLRINQIGSIFSLFFTDKEVNDYQGAKTQDTLLFKKFFQGLFGQGVYFSPSGFEANFLSTAHTNEDIGKTQETIAQALKYLRRK